MATTYATEVAGLDTPPRNPSGASMVAVCAASAHRSRWRTGLR